MNDALCFLTIAEASARVRRREISPVELTQAFLARIDALDPQLHAYIRVTRERAMEDATRAEREIAEGRYRGPLHGIPIALKDVYETRGIPTTAHSRLRLDHIPGADAFTVRRLAEAGTVLLGKLATFEFAVGGPSNDLPFPLARNPWDLARYTGGSSTGSGVAVAGALAMATLGTDAGGSVRIPASYCGVVGLKPTYGRVSRTGVFPLSFTCDHCGPLARTVEDTALVLEAIAGHDPADPVSVDVPIPAYAAALAGADSLKGVRVGLIRHFYDGDVTVAPEVRQSIDAASAAMAELGAEVAEAKLSSLLDYQACLLVILLTEAYQLFERDLTTRPEMFGQIFRDRITMGAFIRGADYVAAMRMRRALIAEMNAAFDRYDVLVTAGMMAPAHRVGETPRHAMFKGKYFTGPFNVTGHPAISVPCGFTPGGLPLGMQIAGRNFDEAMLLRAAHAYERHAGWHQRRCPEPFVSSLGESASVY